MSRTRASARAAGRRFEGTVAGYLAEALGLPVERRRLCGAADRGDLAGVELNGLRAVVECKDCARAELAAWLAEAERERENDGADVAVVAHKRRGVADPAGQYVTMTLGTLARVCAGRREER